MLADLIIDKTEYTPAVFFSASATNFSIVGEARPENAGKFFDPIISWLKHFCEEAHNTPAFKTDKNIAMRFELDYFNSSSIKYLYDVLKQLEFLNPYVAKLDVVWAYEASDEDMYENGVEFSKIIAVNFIFEKRV